MQNNLLLNAGHVIERNYMLSYDRQACATYKKKEQTAVE
jgi:hypothetical protein